MTPAKVVVTVGEFSKRLQEVFRRVRAFDYIGISGEVSEWTPRANGIYFTLKDAQAVLQCFAHHSRARNFPTVTLGSAVVAYGKVRLAEWRSRYELLVDSVEFTGIGELFRQYEALKERFRALGFFEQSRKRKIPRFPNVVALVSARGKGAEDFLQTMKARAPYVRIHFIETRVQGLGADVDLAQALDKADALGADVIVLARGGGSYEDLFSFNCEPVVRAIVRTKTPVVTGVGHTADHHLADEVADLECETPSNAAQFIANLWQSGDEKLARLRILLDNGIAEILADRSQRADRADELVGRAWERTLMVLQRRVSDAERRIWDHNPVARVGRQARRLTESSTLLGAWPANAFGQRERAVGTRHERLASVSRLVFAQRQNALALTRSRLDSSDPEMPLQRGYAIVTFAGRALRDAGDVSPGDSIDAKLARGSVGARVETVSLDE
ncbi:MAG TPA: exodeoxyribonuclease VII large subunit [Candidatus Cybelea sp.]